MNTQTYEITDDRVVIDEWEKRGEAALLTLREVEEVRPLNRAQRRQWAKEHGLLGKSVH